MPYRDDVKLSNRITRILNNNSTEAAIKKISNLSISDGSNIGRNKAKKIVSKYNKHRR
tara:strand:+ start:277 stop:450 length:174 start_codon:yes stop_codon:yes gene_type:complete